MARNAKRVACLIAVAATGAVVPVLAYGDALPSSASITAVDYLFDNGSGGTAATVAAGATVTFAYPSGTSAHNVVFDATQPASCVQDSGGVVGPVPPLPAFQEGPAWSGRCRFDTPGIFTFYCAQHPDVMKGKINVGGVAEPTTTTTTTTTQPTTTTVPPTTETTSTSSPPPTAPLVGSTDPTTTTTSTGPPPTDKKKPRPAASKLSIARIHHGSSIRGSIVIARSRSRLKIAITSGHPAHTIATSSKLVSAGKRTFSISLSASARRTIRRKHRLAVTITVTVTPPSGPPFHATVHATAKR